MSKNKFVTCKGYGDLKKGESAYPLDYKWWEKVSVGDKVTIVVRRKKGRSFLFKGQVVLEQYQCCSEHGISHRWMVQKIQPS